MYLYAMTRLDLSQLGTKPFFQTKVTFYQLDPWE